jgi:hypothetical protein
MGNRYNRTLGLGGYPYVDTLVNAANTGNFLVRRADNSQWVLASAVTVSSLLGIDTLAIDANVLHKTGNESITGTKTIASGGLIVHTNDTSFQSWNNDLRLRYSTAYGGLNLFKESVKDGVLFVDYTTLNIGISTTTPSEKLQVDGNVLVGTTLPILLYNNPAEASRVNGLFYSTDNSGYKFAIGKTVAGVKTDQITILDITGNVGINTTNPQQKFVVSNNGNEGFEVAIGTDVDQRIYLLNFDRVAAAFKPMYFGASSFIFETGDIEMSTPGTGIIQKSPDGTRWKLGVSNAGTTTWTLA